MSEVKDKNFTIFRITTNLMLACLASGVIIAIVYFITSPIAAQNNLKMKNQSMQALVKDAQQFKPVKGKTDWYTAEKGGKTIAYVVGSESKGYGGAIKILVAVKPDGKVIAYDVLSHNETPGLGENITSDKFKSQFKDKVLKTLKVVKDPSDKKDVQAITGATISSRALTKGVTSAVKEVIQYVGGK